MRFGPVVGKRDPGLRATSHTHSPPACCRARRADTPPCRPLLPDWRRSHKAQGSAPRAVIVTALPCPAPLSVASAGDAVVAFASRVAQALPGGLRVLGVFAYCKDARAAAAVPLATWIHRLASMDGAVDPTLGCGDDAIPGSSSWVALQVSLGATKYACKIHAPDDDGAGAGGGSGSAPPLRASPCKLRFQQRVRQDFVEFTAALGVDVRAVSEAGRRSASPGVESAQELHRVAASAVASAVPAWANSVARLLPVIDGHAAPRRAVVGSIVDTTQAHTVSLFRATSPAASRPGQAAALDGPCVTARVTGMLQCVAFVDRSAAVEDAVRALAQDAARYLHHGCASAAAAAAGAGAADGGRASKADITALALPGRVRLRVVQPYASVAPVDGDVDIGVRGTESAGDAETAGSHGVRASSGLCLVALVPAGTTAVSTADSVAGELCADHGCRAHMASAPSDVGLPAASAAHVSAAVDAATSARAMQLSASVSEAWWARARSRTGSSSALLGMGSSTPRAGSAVADAEASGSADTGEGENWGIEVESAGEDGADDGTAHSSGGSGGARDGGNVSGGADGPPAAAGSGTNSGDGDTVSSPTTKGGDVPAGAGADADAAGSNADSSDGEGSNDGSKSGSTNDAAASPSATAATGRRGAAAAAAKPGATKSEPPGVNMTALIAGVLVVLAAILVALLR